MFRVIPAVDLKGGKVVRLVQGRREKVTVEIENPVEVARDWVRRGAKVLHVVDLDGAFEGKLFHEDVVVEIARFAEVQVGGGIRDLRIAERLINRGVDRVIFGTLAVKDVEAVKRFAREYPKVVMVAIDSKGDRVVVEGWVRRTELTPLELAKVYEDCEVSILYTNVDVEGLVSGIEIEKIANVVENVSLPVYVAGGVSCLEDVKAIKRCGAKGVVIGSALYTGKLKLEDVLKVEE